MTRKSFLLILLMSLLSSIGATAQNNSDMVWVTLSTYKDALMMNDIPMYDIRVNIKSKQTAEDNVCVFFRDDKYNNFLYINTHNWKYEDTRRSDGKFNFVDSPREKLSKRSNDKDGFKHPDLTVFGGDLLYLFEINTNALSDNIQVLIDKGDYFVILGKNEEAISFYRQKAEKGDVKSMISLANQISNYNPNEAFSWYKKASDTGDEKAKVKLAECYVKGVGVEKNLTKAESMLLMSNKDLPDTKLLLAIIGQMKGTDKSDVICKLIRDNYYPAIFYAIEYTKPFLNMDLENTKLRPEDTLESWAKRQDSIDCASRYSRSCIRALVRCENVNLLREICSSSISLLSLNHECAHTDYYGHEYIKYEKYGYFSLRYYWENDDNHFLKLLNSGECDFLWCFDCIGIFKCDGDEGLRYKLLYMKLAEIALKKSTDDTLFRALLHLIINTELVEGGYMTSPTTVRPVKYIFTFTKFYDDQEYKSLMLKVFKKGVQLDKECCSSYYEDLLINE